MSEQEKKGSISTNTTSYSSFWHKDDAADVDDSDTLCACISLDNSSIASALSCGDMTLLYGLFDTKQQRFEWDEDFSIRKSLQIMTIQEEDDEELFA